METGLDLLRSQRVKERHLLMGTQQPGEGNSHASTGSLSRVSRITREQTVMMQVARNFNVKDGQLSSVLACSNPAEERRLAAQLQKIENERKRRESTLAWNQRNFFIKQVFDQDNELRFVKAYERPSYLTKSAFEDDFEETILLQPKSKSLEFGKDLPRGTYVRKGFLRRSKTEGALLIRRNDAKDPDNKSDKLQSDGNAEEVVKSNQDSENKSNSDLPKLPLESENIVISAVGDSARYKPENPKAKVKFPLLKVRALGIFAASFRRNEIDSKASKKRIQLPRPKSEVQQTSTLNVYEDNSSSSGQSIKNDTDNFKEKSFDKENDKRLTGLYKKAHSADVNIHDNDKTEIYPAHGKASLNKKGSRNRNTSKGEDLDQLSTNADRKDTSTELNTNSNIYLKTTEYKFKDINSKNKNKNEDRHKFSKDVKSRDTLSRRRQREKAADQENDEKFHMQQEKVLRKLVTTLPTHLLLKTHKREKEAGGISTDDVRRQMIDKARAGMSRSVLKDPRFKNLEDFLNAGKNATYNPRRRSKEILESYNDE